MCVKEGGGISIQNKPGNKSLGRLKKEGKFLDMKIEISVTTPQKYISKSLIIL